MNNCMETLGLMIAGLAIIAIVAAVWTWFEWQQIKQGKPHDWPGGV